MNQSFEHEACVEKRLMKYYAKHISHLWKRHSRQRLTPVVGAGVSKELGLPLWSTLVERLASTSEISISHLNHENPSTATDLLFQEFLEQHRIGKPDGCGEAELSRSFASEWRHRIRASLYGGVLDPECVDSLKLDYDARDRIAQVLDKKIGEHPYLQHLYPIIRRSPLTINYNFDDTLQRLITKFVSTDEEEGRGYETLLKADSSGSRNSCRIYHPNGFLPLNELERASDCVSPRLADT